jgi:hypothetical protein
VTPVNGTRRAGFDQLLVRLGYRRDDPITVCHKPVAGEFSATWTTADKAPEVADDHADSDVWFSVNALPPKGGGGRGKVADVTRLTALYADLDVKPGGMPTAEAAVEVIKVLTEMLGAPAAGIISSGHGFQPLWAIDPDDPAATVTDVNRGDAVALLRRFGRLVAHVADLNGGRVDSVFDLARVLRVPGTYNRKATPILATVSVVKSWRPLTVSEIDEQLTAYGAVEQHGDRDLLGDIVAPAADWAWATATHPAVTRAVASWGQQTPTARHPWLLGAATSLAFARRLGRVTEADHQAAMTVLTTRFLWLLKHTGVPRTATPGEIADCFTFGVAVAERSTESTARADWAFWVELANGARWESPLDEDTKQAVGQFWTSRPVLTHVHDFARARMCSPFAVLGVVLARVITAVPPFVVLPAFVGSNASLNLFVALTGPSGGGKGASEGAAAEAVDVGHLDIATVGSGEGIAHLYAHRGKSGVVRDRDAVLFTVPEVDNLTALGTRQGSTLMPQLRMAWMGERLGFSYADKNKALPIERHTYRMGLILGVQPGRARQLLEDVDGGTPQRMLWMPTVDPEAPDTAPPCPDEWSWTNPGPWLANTHGRAVMTVPDVARAAIMDNRRCVLRGQGNPLDGHALLTRLKVAAALALLDQRQVISVDDWDLGSTVMAVSNATRDSVVGFLARQIADSNRVRGEAEGNRAVVVQRKLDEEQARRVARTILRALRKRDGWATRRDINATVANKHRVLVEDALTALVDSGQVEVRHDDGKALYRAEKGV